MRSIKLIARCSQHEIDLLPLPLLTKTRGVVRRKRLSGLSELVQLSDQRQTIRGYNKGIRYATAPTGAYAHPDLGGSAVTWHCAPHTRGPYKISISSCGDQFCLTSITPFGDAYEKIGTIQRRLAWPLHKDDTLFQSGRPTGLNIYFIFPSQISLLEDVAYFLCMFRTSLPQYLFFIHERRFTISGITVPRSEIPWLCISI
jgi:hypothetical protein